jgi:hypothetical protein
MKPIKIVDKQQSEKFRRKIVVAYCHDSHEVQDWFDARARSADGLQPDRYVVEGEAQHAQKAI